LINNSLKDVLDDFAGYDLQENIIFVGDQKEMSEMNVLLRIPFVKEL
jgi:hypothetical protein